MLLGAVAALAVAIAANPGVLAHGPPPAAPAARPKDPDLFAAFHGQAGVRRVADHLVDRAAADPRVAGNFRNQDLPRLKRAFAAQICDLLDGSCADAGRDTAAVRKGLGVRAADAKALTEDLRWAMNEEGAPFRAQDALLARLAPQRKDLAQR